jgi:UDP-N-acetylmuramate--alanine ligase
MGIGGSGMSAVAQIAKANGFEVTGCDLQTATPYLEKVKKAGIQVFSGHSPDHLLNSDLLCVSPAVFYQSQDSPELAAAKAGKKVLTWQDFMGTYLQKDKYLICIAGTHGKSTVTSLAGLLLEKAGLDPTVEVGATVTAWQNNVRLGKSKYFISEADEFYNNFGTFNPDIIILTLLEFDHPEYFGTVEKMLSVFQDFINRLKPNGRIIVNSDSPLVHKLKLPESALFYSLSQVTNPVYSAQKTSFIYQDRHYELQIPGSHNLSNALGIIELSRLLAISPEPLFAVLSAFTGIGRRLELLGQKNGIKVYDDYANHPSSFLASINGVRQLNPSSGILAVIEPHTFSRLRTLLPQLSKSVSGADEVIVSKIFPSRETDPGDFTGADIVKAMAHPHAIYIPEFPSIVQYLKSKIWNQDVILVMGSGNSYLLSRQILENL